MDKVRNNTDTVTIQNTCRDDRAAESDAEYEDTTCCRDGAELDEGRDLSLAPVSLSTQHHSTC